jgi:hypothetical protein
MLDLIWGKEYRILLIALSDIVLFPGETIPLRLQDQNIVNHVKRILNDLDNSILNHSTGSEDLIIGVVNCPRIGRGQPNLVGSFGTTIEVRSSSCSLLNQNINPYGQNRYAEEIILTGRGQYRFKILSVHHVGGGVNYGTVTLFSDNRQREEHLRYEMCPFPSWVYEINDPATLGRKAFLMVETALFWKVSVFSSLSNCNCNFDLS